MVAVGLTLAELHERALGALDWLSVAAATLALALLYLAIGRLFGRAPLALSGAG
jgi:hypothetical protein